MWSTWVHRESACLDYLERLMVVEHSRSISELTRNIRVHPLRPLQLLSMAPFLREVAILLPFYLPQDQEQPTTTDSRVVAALERF